MKNKVTTLFISCMISIISMLPIIAQAQVSSPAHSVELRARVQLLEHQIMTHGFLYGTKKANYDSLRAWNKQLQEALIRSARQLPDFMKQDFQGWQKQGIELITSQDNKFRIICWNDGMSGTMQVWHALGFWKAGNKIYSMALPMDKPADGWSEPSPRFLSITDIHQTDGDIIYLVQEIAHASGRLKGSIIHAFKIESDTLNGAVPMFRTATRQYHKIYVSLDLATRSSNNRNPYIHLSDDKDTLFIPLVDKQHNIQDGRYLVYRFNGNYFVYQGIENTN